MIQIANSDPVPYECQRRLINTESEGFVIWTNVESHQVIYKSQ